MLTEICQYLKNWFNRKPDGSDYPKYSGKVVISEGNMIFSDGFALVEGQYFRIMGSLFNDGVHKVGDSLVDETFEGAVWSMAVPPDVVLLAQEIEEWEKKYKVITISPFGSENKADYGYTLKSSAGSDGKPLTWKTQFGSFLDSYRKI